MSEVASELVFFPDIEAALVATLRPILDIPVVTRVPNPRPPKFIRLIRVGGPARDLVTDRPMVTLEAWADPSAGGGIEAARLGEQSRGIIHGLVGTWAGGQVAPTWVRRVEEISGLATFPDPETDTPRTQITVQIDVRPRRPS